MRALTSLAILLLSSAVAPPFAEQNQQNAVTQSRSQEARPPGQPTALRLPVKGNLRQYRCSLDALLCNPIKPERKTGIVRSMFAFAADGEPTSGRTKMGAES